MSLSTDTVGPFDVRTEDLKQIDAGQAVDLFRQLLVVEAAKVGVPITAVNVPADINTADGGIDAEISNLSGQALPAGLVFEGLTYYQIKTGKFSASIPSESHHYASSSFHSSGSLFASLARLLEGSLSPLSPQGRRVKYGPRTA